MTPTFCIAIPAYNGERHLRAAIRSALAQTRPADEVLVVADASTDGTLAIAGSPEWGGRVRVYTNERPSGFVDAWNRCVRLSSADFLAILHQDDLLDADFLAKAETALHNYPDVRHLYTNARYVNDSGAIVWDAVEVANRATARLRGDQYAKAYLNGVFRNRHIHRCPGVITNRKLLLEECRYRNEAGHLADDDFFLRVGRYTDVSALPGPGASYRIHAHSATARLASLDLALAPAWAFLLKEHRTESLLGAEELRKMQLLAARSLSRLLMQGVVANRRDWVKAAFDISAGLRGILPEFDPGAAPAWARGLWAVSSATRVTKTSRLYCRATRALASGFRRLSACRQTQ